MSTFVTFNNIRYDIGCLGNLESVDCRTQEGIMRMMNSLGVDSSKCTKFRLQIFPILVRVEPGDMEHNKNGSLEEKPSLSTVYNVQTTFDNLNKPVMLASSTLVYFIEMVVTHPLEVIRTQIQVSQISSSKEIFKQKYAAAGIRGLYAGFWPAVVGHMPGNMTYLLTYTYMKDVLQKYENSRHPDKPVDGRQALWVSFTSAGLADAAAVTFYCPVEVVVQRLFLQSSTNPMYSSTWNVIETVYKTEGIRAFYRGVGPILLNSIPASALWWTIYEQCKTTFSEWIQKYKRKRRIEEKRTTDPSEHHGLKDNVEEALVVHKNAIANLAAGSVAGGIVTFITNPLDVVVTRLQTQSMGTEKYQYKNTWHTIVDMYKTEGTKSFMKGVAPRLAQWVVLSGASAFAYETVVDLSTIRRES